MVARRNTSTPKPAAVNPDFGDIGPVGDYRDPSDVANDQSEQPELELEDAADVAVATLEPPVESTAADLPPATFTAETVEAGDVIENLSRLQIVAEGLLMKRTSEGRLSPGEEQVFKSLGWDNPRIEKETARVRRVLQRKIEAGSPAQYAAVQQQLADARLLQKEKLPRLEAQLQELQREIEAVRSAVTKPSQRLAAMDVARDQLRDKTLLPSHIRDRFDFERARLAKKHRPTNEMESRVITLRSLLRLAPGTGDRAMEQHLSMLPKNHPFHHETPFSKLTNPDWLHRHWATYCETLAPELAELEVKLQQQTAARAADEAETKKILDYYVDQLN